VQRQEARQIGGPDDRLGAVEVAAQRPQELGRGLVALLAIALEGAQADGVELVGNLDVVLRGRHDLGLGDRGQGLVGIGPGEQGAAGEHLPQKDAGREDVAARIELLAADLLRRHVGKRACRATAGAAAELASLAVDREAEVDQLDLALAGQHDVARR
jgi:hypothetical protein